MNTNRKMYRRCRSLTHEAASSSFSWKQFATSLTFRPSVLNWKRRVSRNMTGPGETYAHKRWLHRIFSAFILSNLVQSRKRLRRTNCVKRIYGVTQNSWLPRYTNGLQLESAVFVYIWLRYVSGKPPLVNVGRKHWETGPMQLYREIETVWQPKVFQSSVKSFRFLDSHLFQLFVSLFASLYYMCSLCAWNY